MPEMMSIRKTHVIPPADKNIQQIAGRLHSNVDRLYPAREHTITFDKATHQESASALRQWIWPPRRPQAMETMTQDHSTGECLLESRNLIPRSTIRSKSKSINPRHGSSSSSSNGDHQTLSLSTYWNGIQSINLASFISLITLSTMCSSKHSLHLSTFYCRFNGTRQFTALEAPTPLMSERRR